MKTRSAKEVMLCWNPGGAAAPERLTAACFIESMHLIVRDGCDPMAVHRALLGVTEYRDRCAPNMPAV